MAASPLFDVAIAGYGPTGAVLANLLGQTGRKVVALERAAQIYDLPRAVHFDAEIMRLFQRIGLEQEVDKISGPLSGAEFVNKSGERLLGLVGNGGQRGPLGWRPGSFFYQPDLEQAFREGAARFPSVEVRLGHELTGIEQDDSELRLRVRDLEAGREETVRARYLVGADGAGSFTRRQSGIEFESLGYDCEWLVVDVLLKRPVELPELAQQICDPARPSTFIPATGAHRRWEFQLLEGESAQEMERPERIRELLAPWIGPDDAEIIRACVYEFHGTVAQRWRDGRIFLAGDAAHQMPPFMGQGMCAGLRDAANLHWKLDWVLDGLAPDSLLDSYQSERKPHADDVVDWSISVGKLIDSFVAAQRGDADDAPSAEQQQSGYGGGRRLLDLGPGVLQRDPPEGSPVGQPLPQPRVRGGDGEERLLDSHLGPGFALVGRADPRALVGDAAFSWWRERGARTVALDAFELLDPWLDGLFEQALVAVVRPDRNVAGVAASGPELEALLAELRGAVEGGSQAEESR